MNRYRSRPEARNGPTSLNGSVESRHHEAVIIAAQSFASAVMKSSQIENMGGGDWISLIMVVESAAAKIDHPELKRCLVEPMEVAIAAYQRTLNDDQAKPLAQ